MVDRDSYLLELSRYVHLNPVRIPSQTKRPLQDQIRVLQRYRWSSLKGYWEVNHEQSWVSYDSVLEQIGRSRREYREFIMDGLQRGYDTPWDSVQGQVVLGEQKFVERIKEEVKEKGTEREQPGMRQIQAKAPAAVLRAAARYYGVKEEQLTGKRTGLRDERAVALELVYRHGGGIKQAEIGRLFGGLDYTAVSRERKRLRDKAEQDNKLRRALVEIGCLMSKVKI